MEKGCEAAPGDAGSGLAPDAITYSSAIKACADEDRWERAMKVSDRGTAPDAISYSSAVKACEKGGQLDSTLGLCPKRYSDEGMPGVEPAQRPLIMRSGRRLEGKDMRSAWGNIAAGCNPMGTYQGSSFLRTVPFVCFFSTYVSRSAPCRGRMRCLDVRVGIYIP